MDEFDIALRVRTQSSYQLSIGSSRSSKFYSGQSLCLDDDDISYQISNLCAIKHSQSLNPCTFINSKTEYIIQFDFDDQKKFQQQEKAQKTKQTSNSAPSYNYKKTMNYSIPYSISKLVNSYKRSPNLSSTDLLNTAYGAMFGFIIGDAIGSHLIHKSQNIQELITHALQMKGGGIFNLHPGQGTDETQLALTLSQGLLECSSKDQNAYDKDIIANRYLQWFQSKPFDFPTLVAISFSEIRKQKIRNNGNFNLQKIGQDLQNGSIRNKNHESSLSLIKMIPLTLWSLNLSDTQFVALIRQQMKLFAPNQFSIEVSIVYGKILRQILNNRDHEYAIHDVSKWIYSNGSDRLINLWKLCQKGLQIQICGQNMNSISVPFLFSLNQINKKQINFVDSLIKILLKGYNTDTNCAIVMGLVGAAIGYNRIPNYFKNKIIDCRIQNSQKQRSSEYCSSKIVDIVSLLLQKGPKKLKISNSK